MLKNREFDIPEVTKFFGGLHELETLLRVKIPPDYYPEVQWVLMAEDRQNGREIGCYCQACLSRLADYANAAMEILLDLCDKKRKQSIVHDYSFYVVSGGIRSTLIRGWQVDEYKYEAWMKKAGENSNRTGWDREDHDQWGE